MRTLFLLLPLAFLFLSKQSSASVRPLKIGSTPIGLTLNNPTNIKLNKNNNWLGKLPSPSKIFENFSSKSYGYRAAFELLETYQKNGYNTVEKIISRWAPPIENDTKAYIKFVSNKIGLAPYTTVSESYIKPLVAAMALIETGDTDTSALNAGYQMSKNS